MRCPTSVQLLFILDLHHSVANWTPLRKHDIDINALWVKITFCDHKITTTRGGRKLAAFRFTYQKWYHRPHCVVLCCVYLCVTGMGYLLRRQVTVHTTWVLPGRPTPDSHTKSVARTHGRQTPELHAVLSLGQKRTTLPWLLGDVLPWQHAV